MIRSQPPGHPGGGERGRLIGERHHHYAAEAEQLQLNAFELLIYSIARASPTATCLTLEPQRTGRASEEGRDFDRHHDRADSLNRVRQRTEVDSTPASQAEASLRSRGWRLPSGFSDAGVVPESSRTPTKAVHAQYGGRRHRRRHHAPLVVEHCPRRRGDPRTRARRPAGGPTGCRSTSSGLETSATKPGIASSTSSVGASAAMRSAA